MAFGFSFPKLPTQAIAGDPSQDGAQPGLFGSASGLTMADKLMMFGAIAKGHPEMAMQIPLMAAARRQFQVQQAATDDLARAASGKPVPTRAEIAATMGAPPLIPDSDGLAKGVDIPPMIANGGAMGGVSIPGSDTSSAIRLNAPTYVPPRDPSADAGAGGPASVRTALPMLARLARAGGNTEPWLKMLDAAQPKAVVVNGRVLDEHNPDIYGGYYGEAPAKGAEPVYNRGGQQIGWRMMDGSIQAIQAEAAAQAEGQKSVEARYAEPIAAGTAAGTAKGRAPYTLETKDVNGVPVTATTQRFLEMAGAGGSPASAAGSAAPAQGGARLDPHAFFKGFVLPHEGGLNPADLNGSPTNFGFNQAANSDIDVRKLTPDTAAARFADNYFAQSGAADLPPALAAVHADTYFINPAKAKQLLAQSGGDPGKYMDLRSAWLQHIAQTNPDAAKYGPVWAKRDADLRALSDQLAAGQGGAPPPAAAGVGFHGVNPADQKKVDAYMEDAHTAEDVAQKAHQFQDLNKKTFTGPIFNPVRIHIPLLGDVPLNPISGIGSAFQPGSQAMDNLSMQMATGLRAPGQRLTQAEIFQNLKTVPRRGSLPASNDTSAEVIDNRAATKRAYANFMADYLVKNGSLNGADAAWAAQQSGGARPAAAAPSAKAPMRPQPMQQIKLKSGGTATVVPVG